MNVKTLLSTLFLVLLFGSVSVFAHDTAKHKPKADTTVHTHMAAHTDSVNHMSQAATVPLNDFPSLHPLVVHIPIMLLIIAAILNLLSFIVFKKEFYITAWAMLLLGFIGAYASSNWVHPHTELLPAATQHLLEEHERFADYTVWASGVALLLYSVNLFMLKRKMWLSVVVAVLLTASAVFVALAGHHGAELVHKHGVGAKGVMLDQHH